MPFQKTAVTVHFCYLVKPTDFNPSLLSLERDYDYSLLTYLHKHDRILRMEFEEFGEILMDNSGPAALPRPFCREAARQIGGGQERQPRPHIPPPDLPDF